MKTKSDIKDRFVIIMAGGRGERFWPLSREKMPKQLLALLTPDQQTKWQALRAQWEQKHQKSGGQGAGDRE